MEVVLKAVLKYAILSFFLLLMSTVTVYAATTNVIRNGDFSAGLVEWNINPALPSTWNPLSGGEVSLHPPTSEFNGPIIYQNLNVTAIANIQFTLGFTLTKAYAPSGHTIAVYLEYVNSANQLVRVKAANPDNDTITSATPVSASYTFPANARKLVKIHVDKEAYGDFTIDNVTLSGNGITVGGVPVITSLSSDSGAYGSSLTITGTGFGASQGSVRIGGSSGVVVTSWSNTSIAATVNDPARSGPVVVVSDFTESNVNNTYTVTSPNYTVDLMEQTLQVVKGQTAEFVLNAGLVNGFTTAAGISFSVSGLPGGTVYSFAPVPLKRNGGVALRIATATLTPGTFNLVITSTEASSAPRVVSGNLIVTTTGTLDFYQTDPVTYEQSIITTLSVTQQGSLALNAVGVDSGGKPVTGIQVTSSNPFIVGAYKNGYGTYDYYAHSSGPATLTATAPDGVPKTLNVTVALPTEPYVSISLNPQTITNKNNGFIDHWITFNTQTGQSQSITASLSGNVTYVEGSSTLDFTYPQTEPPTYGGHFKIDHTKTQLGSYMYSGSISGGTASAANAVPLIITNDPTYAGLDMVVKSLDSSLSAHMFEFFDIEFYNNAGTLLFTRSNKSFSMGDTFFIGAIDPGSYKVRFVPMSAQISPQWYPNADSAADAQLITFTAGANDGPRYFFARKAPDTSPPIVTEFTLPATSASLTVTGIVLSGYDGDSGVSGYCLTEVNDAAGCTWLVSSPTQYTFATSGPKTLYAFLKDSAGNISVTDGTSTKTTNIVLQFPLTLAFAGTGGGDVNGDMSCSSEDTCNDVLFTEGSTVDLTASPDGDSTFAGWSGCTSVADTTCHVTMNAAKTVTVNFAAVPPVKILGGSAAGFATLRLAYDAASTNVSAPSTIQVRSVILPDSNLSFDLPVRVTVEGGYDKLFSLANTGISTIQGPVTFKGGPVTIENLTVK
jgi:hypothetical protein